MSEPESFTVFVGQQMIASGNLLTAAKAVELAMTDYAGPILTFDDLTGQTIELDLRHGAERAVSGFQARTAPPELAPPPAGRGRPRLGVIAREVTLLPRHWDWLARQPGGASAALRRLVEEARRNSADSDRTREGRQALYNAMSVLAGDLPNFEAATRALFADHFDQLSTLLNEWPADVAEYLARILGSYRF